MRQIHFLTGMPLSGSTLLRRILRTNTNLYVTATSPVYPLVTQLKNSFAINREFQRDLDRRKEETIEQQKQSLRGFVDGWYHAKDTVIDKEHRWLFEAMVVRDLWPNARMLVCVRNMPDIYASAEKQHRINPLLDDADTPILKTLRGRADHLFHQDQLLGRSIFSIQDVLDRSIANCIVVRYEDVVNHPEQEMARIYRSLGEMPFTHDFDNIPNIPEEEMDSMYLFRYSHEGPTKITPPKPEAWKDVLPEDLGNLIYNRFPWYNEQFNYRTGGRENGR